VQVVDNDYFVSRVEESEGGEGANIAHATTMQSEEVSIVVFLEDAAR
jgi:hypothetical protein